MLGKLLLLVAILVAAWVVWRYLKASAEQRRARRDTPLVEDMVRCLHCGMHVPRTEAVPGPGGAGAYCCDEHRRLGPR
jgi:uncharacterized protein